MGDSMTESAEALFADRPPRVRHSAGLGTTFASGLAPAGLLSITNDLPPIEDGSLPVDDAFAAILQCDLERVRASRPVAESGEDPEGVHLLRVALRRLRGSLALLGGLVPSDEIDAFRGEAKWLASGLGDARAWDLFLSETLTEVEQGSRAVTGFKELREAVETCRVQSYDRVRKLLANRKCRRFQLELASMRPDGRASRHRCRHARWGRPDAAERPRSTSSLIQVKGSPPPLPHDADATGLSGPGNQLWWRMS